jgi:signal transduction histidine kinase
MGDMVSAIAHQWRQPLNALGLIVQDVNDAYEFGEMTKEYVEKLVKDCMFYISEMSQTIDDFRNFFKSSKEKVMFDLIQAFEEIDAIIGPKIMSDKINMRIDYGDGDDDFMVFGYPNEFKQIVINIIRNSQTAIEDRKQQEAFEGNIDIEISRSAQHVSIVITDNGGGISESNLSRLFDPYFTTKNDGKSLGIGLYMAKAIVETNMGGEIHAKNYKDGLRVTIVLQHGYQG